MEQIPECRKEAQKAQKGMSLIFAFFEPSCG
jgi:hypothetical protein